MATIASLRRAARSCKACPLWKCGTQTVFGEGPAKASIVIVGEQPGDVEDREGHPFVGPSGLLLDRAMDEAGLDRGDAYVTNAVKHFKWTRSPDGKRRLHKSPSVGESKACFPWLRGELLAIKPRALLCLGATATRSALGNSARVLRDRGKKLDTEWAEVAFVTVHPSAVLRSPRDQRKDAERAFVADLTAVAKWLGR